MLYIILRYRKYIFNIHRLVSIIYPGITVNNVFLEIHLSIFTYISINIYLYKHKILIQKWHIFKEPYTEVLHQLFSIVDDITRKKTLFP